jgi:hypothetical protein
MMARSEEPTEPTKRDIVESTNEGFRGKGGVDVSEEGRERKPALSVNGRKAS